jgi:uncharacterized protein (TIGR02453 family)
MPAAHFDAALFRFLTDLRKNNRRDWFNANKERFEEEVRRPMLRFISDFGDPLKKVAPRMVADPRPVGGSLFRIYRDTRFSKDKTPYKTHAAAHFQHAARTQDVHAPGYYLHLEPGGSFVGGGLWRPEPPVAQKIREAIAGRHKKWQAAVRGVRLEGDSLKRPPRGFEADDPAIEDLKRKDFITSFALADKVVTSGRFMTEVAERCRRMAPMMRFLTEAVGLDW